MIIANPIYDVVFKRLMENDKVAKFFIGTLMEENIETVEVLPQEYTYKKEELGFSVFRLDFVATIRTETGEQKKVLIEIQKVHNQIDLMRFRNYLGEQYKKQDLINGEETALPIVTIYILGFNLANVDSACIKVERHYRDLINHTVLKTKNEFIERLTHDSFVVQVGKIEPRVQNRLEQLLSIFEQRNFIDDKKILKDYPYSVDTEEIKAITDILQYTGANATERKKIEDEKEAMRTFYAYFGQELKEYQNKLAESRRKLEESESKLQESENKLQESENKLEESENKLEESESKLQEEKRKAEELKRVADEEKRKAEELKRVADEEKQKAFLQEQALLEKNALIEELLKKLNEKS